MTTIASALQAVRSKIAEAAAANHRREDEVELIAVSKGVSPEQIDAAYQAGQRHFGESYVQEATAKMAALNSLSIVWHFIGPIQSNKTRDIARFFSWVHSVDRDKIAERLNDARPHASVPLNICLQVNISGEASKQGVAPNALQDLAQATRLMPQLTLRGLMAIPKATPDIVLQRAQFRRLREMQETLNQTGYRLDTLSMGMSEDFEAAIAEGATMVRVGTAIFGRRQ